MAYCFITITTVQIGMFLSGLLVELIFYLNYTNSTENMGHSNSEYLQNGTPLHEY